MRNNITTLYEYFLETPQVYIDSRKVEGPGLFFAIRGPNFNGNDYALQALIKGATWAVVDDPVLKDNKGCFLVKDSLVALQKLAQRHRRAFDIPVIGITGTNGKTTTKELSQAVLSQKFSTLATLGNKNNHIGVPLTILKLTEKHEIVILEMGANRPKDIAFLCQIGQPTHGLITNIGKAHLEGFGDLDTVTMTKKELFDYIAGRDGIFLVNSKHNDIIAFSQDYHLTSTFGESENDVWRIIANTYEPYLSGYFIDGKEKVPIETQLIGQFNWENIQSAVALGQFFGVDGDLIKKGIETYTSDNNRSQLIKRGSCNIFMDAYNANPTSMFMATEFMSQRNAVKKILILGDMLELGSQSRYEHADILDKIDQNQWTEVILIGQEFMAVNQNRYPSFGNISEAQSHLEQLDTNDSWILIKGSRGMALEKGLDFLTVGSA